MKKNKKVELCGFKKLPPNRYSKTRYMDSFGRIWHLEADGRYCPVCGQPDDFSDCDHTRLTDKDVESMYDEATQIKDEKGLLN